MTLEEAIEVRGQQLTGADVSPDALRQAIGMIQDHAALAKVQRRKRAKPAKAAVPWGLSPQQCELLELLIEGMSVLKAGQNVGSSRGAVSTQMTRIRRKMRVTSNLQAVLAWDRLRRPHGDVRTAAGSAA